MYEVEVKAKLNNRQALKTKLESLGCTFSEELHQVDDIFTPVVEAFPPPKGIPVLRIRNQNGKHILTLKINQSSRQDCIEHETVFDSVDQMEAIIELMGFKRDVTVEKRRIKTMYKDVEIVLDTVEQLGEFVEAEKIVTENSREVREQIQRSLMDLLVELGVPREDEVIDGKYDIMLREKLDGK
ncbi:MAG: class IV adenylate cyclase [bacterium]